MDDHLQYLLDRREIDDLMARYCQAVDRHRWDLLDAVFTPDARLDYSSAGGVAGPYPEVREWLAASVPQMEVMHHLVPNTTVEIDGDRARATSSFLDPNVRTEGEGTYVFTVGGYYHDELVRTPEGWRIARRVEETLFWDPPPFPGMPTRPGPAPGTAAEGR